MPGCSGTVCIFGCTGPDKESPDLVKTFQDCNHHINLIQKVYDVSSCFRSPYISPSLCVSVCVWSSVYLWWFMPLWLTLFRWRTPWIKLHPPRLKRNRNFFPLTSWECQQLKHSLVSTTYSHTNTNVVFIPRLLDYCILHRRNTFSDCKLSTHVSEDFWSQSLKAESLVCYAHPCPFSSAS